MTLGYWLTLLFSIGVVYALWHVWVAELNRRLRILSGQNGLMAHAATGDLRRAIADLVLAVLLLAIVELPMLIPLIGHAWFSLLQGFAFILLGSTFVVGMAFSRLHEIHRTGGK
jgi:hypothetical protein